MSKKYLVNCAEEYDSAASKLEELGLKEKAKGARRAARELRFAAHYGVSGQELAKRVSQVCQVGG